MKIIINDKVKIVSQKNGLNNLLNNGFIEIDECIFIKDFYILNSHIKKTHFSDLTGFECFINCFKLTDYDLENSLFNAIVISQVILKKIKSLNTNNQYVGIISESDELITLRFHKERTNESWINENQINSFSEKLIICKL